jgi:hypothetical protein
MAGVVTHPRLPLGLSGSFVARVLSQHVFASLDVALEKVGDAVEALLRVRFLGEVFSLTGNVNEGLAQSWLAAIWGSGPGGRLDQEPAASRL